MSVARCNGISDDKYMTEDGPMKRLKIHKNLADVDTLVAELQDFLKAEPDSANLNFFVGDALLQTEQVEPAVPYLEKAVKLDPKLLPAHASLGLCYGRLGESLTQVTELKEPAAVDTSA